MSENLEKQGLETGLWDIIESVDQYRAQAGASTTRGSHGGWDFQLVKVSQTLHSLKPLRASPGFAKHHKHLGDAGPTRPCP